MTRLYFGIENLNLTAGQKNTLISGLQGLGDNAADNPSHRNHWRVRLDNDAIIFEANFDENLLTIAAIKSRLATIFSVAVGTISHSTSDNAYGKVITFTHSAQQKLRMIAFGMSAGGAWGTWDSSNAAARAYLAVNSAAWDGEA